MAGCGHLLERLLAKVEARDLVLARGENKNPHPLVFAKLFFPYSSMPHWLETKQTGGCALLFPISWYLLEKDKTGGLKRISNLDIVNLMHGWHGLSVGLRSQRFQEHVIERMLEAANGSEIFVKQNYYNAKKVFLPRASCVEEVRIRLDINETEDERARNLQAEKLRNLIKSYY